VTAPYRRSSAASRCAVQRVERAEIGP